MGRLARVGPTAARRPPLMARPSVHRGVNSIILSLFVVQTDSQEPSRHNGDHSLAIDLFLRQHSGCFFACLCEPFATGDEKRERSQEATVDFLIYIYICIFIARNSSREPEQDAAMSGVFCGGLVPS